MVLTAKQAQVVKGLQDIMYSYFEETQETKQEQIVTLQKENLKLKESVSQMEDEIVAMKDYLQQTLSNFDAQLQKLQSHQPEDQRGKNQPNNDQRKEKVEEKQEQEVDEEKAERWVREHVAEWIDQLCHFKKANGRTWRELAENKGEKIPMNGKGRQSSRAYLHAIENWNTCSVWARVKAKVVLEVVKNGHGSCHYSHQAKVGA